MKTAVGRLRRAQAPQGPLWRLFNVNPPRLWLVIAWCLAAGIIQSAGAAVPLEDADVRAIDAVIVQADAGELPSVSGQSLGTKGMVAALRCGLFLDESKPARSRILYEAIGFAGNCRRSHAEVLKLYQPGAFELFYTNSGLTLQRQLAVGLSWKEWPASLAEAVVRAAPVPTLEWLRAQAASRTPDLKKLAQLIAPIGWWLRTHNERQYVGEFHQAIAAMSANAAIGSDPLLGEALLGLIADAGATECMEWVCLQCHAGEPKARAAAVKTLGQLVRPHTHDGEAVVADKSSRALKEFVSLAVSEQEPVVLSQVATAAEGWPQEEQAGAAVLSLFHRCSMPDVRRAILFSVINTRWPQRGQIMLAAFDKSGDGVLGVALQAVAAHPLPELLEPTLALLAAQNEVQPQLIDAAGALGDARAVPYLARWLKAERNAAVRLKLILALERIAGDASGAILSALLASEAEPMLAEHLCRIAGRRELPGAAATLASLVGDHTAPMLIRTQALWALGRYSDAAARECFEKLSRSPEMFAVGMDGPVTESSHETRLFVTLARLRRGDAAAADELSELFETATPSARLTCLLALAEIKRDHPVIATALESADFAVLLGAIKAAGAAAPAKYHQRLLALRERPFIAALLNSGLDSWRMPDALQHAIEAGAL